jgi:hypothetical protein
MSPLHLAIWLGENAETSLALIAAGCDVDGWSFHGVGLSVQQTALHLAIHEDAALVALALIHAGCDMDVDSLNEGKSAGTTIWIAITKGQVEIAMALIGSTTSQNHDLRECCVS